MHANKIAVVGAGIGGLAVAAGLLRHGIACEIFEQADGFGEAGAGVQIAPNAARLLHRLGIAERIDRVAIKPDAVEMRHWCDNLIIARTRLGAECAQRYGAPYYTFHRVDLHRVLLDLIPRPRVHLDHRCAGVSEHDDVVTLDFANGATWRGDLVIGADGVRSTVRAALVPDNPRFSGQAMYRGLVPADRLPHLAGPSRVRLWLGPNQHCVCYPIARGLFSFGATVPAGDSSPENWTEPGRVEDLAAAYRGWHQDVQRIIDVLDNVSRWALHDRDPVTRWSSKRITLVGDAAHPMLPFMAQGANQAIEDAFVLAKYLTRTTSTRIPDSLAGYERARVARTAEVQRISRNNGMLFHLPDDDAQRERDWVMSMKQELPNQAWLFGYDAELSAGT